MDYQDYVKLISEVEFLKLVQSKSDHRNDFRLFTSSNIGSHCWKLQEVSFGTMDI